MSARTHRFALVAALTVVVLGAATASASAARLYFQSGRSIVSMDPAKPFQLTTVVDQAGTGATGVSVGAGHLYWITGDRTSTTEGRLWSAGLHGGNPHVIVSGVNPHATTAVVGNYVFWIDANGISRVDTDGTHLHRQLIALAAERSGGVAEDIVGSGSWLYFSRCDDSVIERVRTSGKGVAASFIRTGAKSCPQGLGIGNGNIYWSSTTTQSPSPTIGRATLSGAGIQNRWLVVGGELGPWDVAAGGGYVYWSHGLDQAQGGADFVGRARANGTQIVRRIARNPAIFSLGLLA